MGRLTDIAVLRASQLEWLNGYSEEKSTKRSLFPVDSKNVSLVDSMCVCVCVLLFMATYQARPYAV